MATADCPHAVITGASSCLPITPVEPGNVVTACLAGLDLGETICLPGLADPATIEHYHTAAHQLIRSNGQDLASRYLTTALPDTHA